MGLADNLRKLKKDEFMAIFETENIRNLTAKDAMIKPVFLYPDDEANKILKKLKREGINVCIVVTKDKRFVGEISDADIIKLFLHQVKHEPLTQILNIGYKKGFAYKCADDLINKHNSRVSPDTPINEVIELVYKEDFDYIPVLDKKKKVIGVVTPSSLIDLLRKQLSER